MHLPVHVHGHIDEVIGHAIGGSILSVEHERYCEIVIAAFGLPGLHAMPREVWVAKAQIVLVKEVIFVAKHFVLTTELDDMLEVAEDISILLQVVPVEPRNLIVLTIGVVIALLRVAHLIARQHHGYTLAHHEHGDGIFHLLVTQAVDVGIIAFSLAATVPTVIMVFAIAIVLTVGFIMLFVIRHEVHHRKTIVCRNEVHAGLNASSLQGIEVGRANDALFHITKHAFVALQEAAHAIAEFTIPLGPASP